MTETIPSLNREQWVRSLPDPIKPAQIVERMSAALDYVGAAATDIIVAKKDLEMPLSLANAQRDAIKLIDGAKLYAIHAPETQISLGSEAGKKGVAVGLALFDGLDDLRRKAMGAAPAEEIVNPIKVARDVAKGARELGNALPTLAIIAGLLWLATKVDLD